MTDFQSDLLADLQGAANARPLPPSPPPLPPAEVGELHPTPALDVRLTPLRWSRPRVSRRAVRLGPVQVSLSFEG